MSDRPRLGGSTAALAGRLGGISWGVFFIWIGIAFLANLGWGVGIIGVGLIALGAQAARLFVGLPVEGFWVAVGAVFIAWGAWELLEARFGGASGAGGLLPILFIVVGVLLIAVALRRPSG